MISGSHHPACYQGSQSCHSISHCQPRFLKGTILPSALSSVRCTTFVSMDCPWIVPWSTVSRWVFWLHAGEPCQCQLAHFPEPFAMSPHYLPQQFWHFQLTLCEPFFFPKLPSIRLAASPGAPAKLLAPTSWENAPMWMPSPYPSSCLIASHPRTLLI